MKRKIVKTLMAAMVTTTLFGTGTLTAHAADYVGQFDSQAAVMISQVFDAEYYAATYPDVVAVLGDDEAVLLNHYLTCGIFEGRDASATFNADAYASANADLVTFYDDGDDDHVDEYTNYFFHYVSCGQTEGRIATVADATAAGYTVTSVADETKTIAKPTVTKSYTSSGSGSSSSSSSSSSSGSSGSSSTSSTASSTDSSSSSSNTSSTTYYTATDYKGNTILVTEGEGFRSGGVVADDCYEDLE